MTGKRGLEYSIRVRNGAPGSLLRMALRVVLVTAVGCGSQANPPAVDVTGTWVGNVDSTDGPPGFNPVFGNYTLTLDLVQTGPSVTGTFRSDGAFNGTIVGTVTDDRAVLTVSVPPCGGQGNSPETVQLMGTVQDSGSAFVLMDIAYQGTPCGVADHGTGVLRRL